MQKKENIYLEKQCCIQKLKYISSNYITGFDNQHHEILNVDLSISENYFSFFTMEGSLIGQINIDSIRKFF